MLITLYMKASEKLGTPLGGGVPIIRAIVHSDLYWGPLFWETIIYIYICIRIVVT